MISYHNHHGWLSNEPIEGREAFIFNETGAKVFVSAPDGYCGSPMVGQPWPNWTGDRWVVIDYYLPPVQQDDERDTKMTVLAFRNRFTAMEKRIINIASVIDPAASQDHKNFAADVRAMLDDINAAKYIDVSRPDTRYGVQMLEQAQLIGVGRAAEILDTPIADHERA
jgi:hypothetical protein